jgi:hypothetical protein
VKLAIVGPRDLELPVAEVQRVVTECKEVDLEAVTEIVTGDALGIDRAAIKYAKVMGLPWVAFGAGWGKLKRGAGPERNGRVVRYLEPRSNDTMLALYDRSDTPGTTDVTNQASAADIFVVLHQDKRWSKYRRKDV